MNFNLLHCEFSQFPIHLPPEPHASQYNAKCTGLFCNLGNFPPLPLPHADFNMNINPEELVSPRLTQKQMPSAMDIEGQSPTLDEGFLDLTLVKEITMGSRNHEYDLELLAAGKRFGLTHVECCVSILYGNTLNDNRVLCLLCPPMLCR